VTGIQKQKGKSEKHVRFNAVTEVSASVHGGQGNTGLLTAIFFK
jgi:hypothetical protein